MNIEFPKHCTAVRVTWAIFLAALLSMLAACGTPMMKPDQALAIKKIGIVSLLPSELSYQKIGITVFNNERATRPVDSAFNSAARASAENALKITGRNVMQLEVDVPTLAKRVRSGAIIFDSSAERIHDELGVLIKKHKLDAIVLILESFDAENGINGIRMFLRAGLKEINTANAMPDVTTLVVDANIKMLAGQSNRVYFPVARPGGQPWAYRLEENLDVVTHQHVTNLMQKATASAVTQHLQTMGF
ncbi:MAG: hypothetical protein JWR60_3903 [Polaromonas sp.]|nr:hypothetical protein [Polaromonas sp.]